MKKTIKLITLVVLALGFSSCAISVKSPYLNNDIKFTADSHHVGIGYWWSYPQDDEPLVKPKSNNNK